MAAAEEETQAIAQALIEEENQEKENAADPEKKSSAGRGRPIRAAAMGKNCVFLAAKTIFSAFFRRRPFYFNKPSPADE
jgi:hypothetical protein